VASLYYRGDAIWVSYRAPDGKWKCKSTGRRRSNFGDLKQAELPCKELTLREHTEQPIQKGSGWARVDGWIAGRWGHLNNNTPINYRQAWHKIQRWLAELDLHNPVNVTRELALGYVAWRAKRAYHVLFSSTRQNDYRLVI
jgi:hypothetical protein